MSNSFLLPTACSNQYIPDVNAEDKEGASPIHLAAFNGSIEKLEKLSSIEGVIDDTHVLLFVVTCNISQEQKWTRRT